MGTKYANITNTNTSMFQQHIDLMFTAFCNSVIGVCYGITDNSRYVCKYTDVNIVFYK